MRTLLVATLLVLSGCSACGDAAGEGEGEDVLVGEGEGEGEGQGVIGTACLVDDECGDGAVCFDDGTGFACRVDCGDTNDDGDFIERGAACSDGTACQSRVFAQDEAFVADTAVCLAPVRARDAPCVELLGDDACVDAVCDVVDVDDGGAGTSALATRCKVTCDPDADDCGDGEVCVGARYSFVPGWCGVPVPLATSADALAAGNGDPVDDGVICDDVGDHRVCDDRAFAALSDPSPVFCARGRVAADDGDTDNAGLCMSICHQASFDYDDDGIIDDDEQAFDKECPVGLVCGRSAWANLGQIDDADDFLACDPDACPAGAACDDCGGRECVLLFGSVPTCGIALGSCEAPAAAEGEGEGEGA